MSLKWHLISPWYSQCVITPWDSPPPITTPGTTITTVITTITTLPPPTTVTLVPDDPFTGDRWRQDFRSPAHPTQGVDPAADPASSPTEIISQDEKRQTGPGSTLQAGWYWVRAVVPPNYHKYLQTKPANMPGTAILESYRSAGQFKVADGQAVANTGDQATPLYLHVEKPADFTQRALATWFNTTENDFGTFAWSGDALTWSAPEVKRQNLAAWLVCKNQALFINTGAYAYQTPAGCADQTIHYYNDAHANE
ncbi:hypothetical protein F4808DRAFT_311622 [Astrocystis sublimbata]|nr:hypothetical protein F4808DRAFT_311622 [Astrocystis sublimbata]